MKKTRGLYHVSEGRYFNFSPGRFSEIVAILTAPAVDLPTILLSAHSNVIPVKFAILEPKILKLSINMKSVPGVHIDDHVSNS
jgi:hypothetical protein